MDNDERPRAFFTSKFNMSSSAGSSANNPDFSQRTNNQNTKESTLTAIEPKGNRKKPKSTPTDSQISQSNEQTVIRLETSNLKQEDKRRQVRTANRREPVQKPKTPISLDTELNQLKIRFPSLQVKSTENDPRFFNIILPITDPDFPYEVDSIDLHISLPSDYPGTGRPRLTVCNTEIPPKYRDVVNQRMSTTAKKFSDNTLVIRDMLRYLEKNFEALLTENAAVNRFKFFSSESIKVTKAITPLEESLGRMALEDDFIPFAEDSDTNSQDLELDHGQDNHGISLSEQSLDSRVKFKEAMIIQANINSSSSVRGDTFFLMLVNHKLQNVSWLTCTLLSLGLACSRCKSPNVIKDIRPYSDRFESCVKCKCRIDIHFEPDILHQYSAKLATLRIGRAVPMDLIPSQMQIECFMCQKAIQITDVAIGDAINSKFPFCFHPFILSLGECIFQKQILQSKTQSRVSNAALGISIGSPLPKNGACEHYGKSFRWYRFPCCGRAFPCDDCHDEQTKDQPHEAERAQRFICGYCAREQSISSKRCACGVDWSRGAAPVKTTFWEGGKGMRNQTAMSRKDAHKYKGLSK